DRQRRRRHARGGEARARSHRRRRHHDRPRRAGTAVAVPRDLAVPRDWRAGGAGGTCRDSRGAARASRSAVPALWRGAGDARGAQAHRMDGARPARRRRVPLRGGSHRKRGCTAFGGERLFLQAGRMNRQNELADSVKRSLERYFKDMDGEKPTSIYYMVLKNVEKPMIEMVLAQAKGNQTLAAQMLGINRNTLRTKMQQLRIKGWCRKSAGLSSASPTSRASSSLRARWARSAWSSCPPAARRSSCARRASPRSRSRRIP